ncbi:hypothetical protein EMIHUDRAFT_211484 [Emiliania huxleyi CCMP1516]|uniref:Exonuclease domain-containing protein n=2 Tax=Emiliania huxleyi TaxID=2903 RepID=A0A0D3IVP3_EMIH1|nr:hypothetical protein EMIHUDRAFT_211484 [Emiliania huxleyi CCMP1516]EOD15328.1 hypothetical protein EMIHUDRAFT_211484 [Emiliania huxleyi CCMP1516]|eukprot:XP_005767757.1 hypothetical protein EMIHUDRAFT_211484 [Emiliania huxleyi CCMP1516]
MTTLFTLLASSWSRCRAVRAAPVRLSRRCRVLATLPQQEWVAGLAFDLETTGLNTDEAEIVQFACVVANSRREGGASFCEFVMPQCEIDPGASAVTGITKQLLAERGARPFAEVWATFEGWLRETLVSETRPLVWSAHNGDRFDVPILRRCVRDATGGPSPLLSEPRAAFGAHDALVDAEALARVWRWLIEEQGADAASAAWAASAATAGQPSLAPFQAHLQYRGYGLEPATRTAPAAPSSSGAGDASRAARRPSTPRGGDADSLERVAGIGPALSKKLNSKGIGTYDELERAWAQRGRDHRRMLGWLVKSMPGTNRLALAKAVRGMAAEWPV